MFKVAAIYKFARIEDTDGFRNKLLHICKTNEVKGTMIVANEGINGTIASSHVGINNLIEFLNKEEKFSGMEVKFSYVDQNPFYHMRISIKKEIVTMGMDLNLLDDSASHGTYVEPSDWDCLVNNPDVLVLDTRNDYEYQIGTFKNAINPNIRSFREFPQYVESKLDRSRHKSVAMFCTGGIRCEKASSYMLNLGFENVYNLKGGILKYLEEKEEHASSWTGECFVFDQRVSVKHGLKPGNCKFCRSCRMPLTPQDRGKPEYEEGVSCPHCHASLTEKKILAARERNLQIKLAEERNQCHLGYKHEKHSDKKEKILKDSNFEGIFQDSHNVA